MGMALSNIPKVFSTHSDEFFEDISCYSSAVSFYWARINCSKCTTKLNFKSPLEMAKGSFLTQEIMPATCEAVIAMP